MTTTRPNLQQDLFTSKFHITSIESDPSRWNKEWEKALRAHTSKEVYQMYKPKRWDPSVFSQFNQQFKEKISSLQETIVKLWEELESKEHFHTAWMLLGDGERKRHLLNGFKETFANSVFGQDSRALCPEITLSSMLKRKGQVFIDYLTDYKNQKKEIGVDNAYFLPSLWWEKALEDLPQPVSEEDTSKFAFLTHLRNDFISESSSSSAQIYLRGIPTLSLSSIPLGQRNVSSP